MVNTGRIFNIPQKKRILSLSIQEQVVGRAIMLSQGD